MPVIAGMLLKVLTSTLASMAVSLITKSFLKTVIIAGLERLVKATDSDVDNKLLEEAKKAWAKEDEK